MRRAVLLPAAALLAGCGPFAPAPPAPAATVFGTVRVDGQPPGQPGWICFWPEPRTVGDPAYARIAADGTFRAVGVPRGRVQPRIRFRDPARLPPNAWAALAAVAGVDSRLRLDANGAEVRFDPDLSGR